jgi:Zn-finger nucleic acid-binding protein
MAPQHVASGTLETCDSCGGAYLDAALLESMLSDVQHKAFDRIELVARAAPQNMQPASPGTNYVKCPDCRTIMNRRQFAHGAGVVLDGCKGHGTFFDAGELRKVVDFMKSGGLEKAAAIEQQRLTAQKLSDARKRAELRAVNAHTLPVMSAKDDGAGGVLAEIVLSLFW